MLISHLVHIDEHGAFRSDVQLSDYDDPKLNLDLLHNYIFTVSAPSTSRAGRDVSAKDVLETLKSAFTLVRFENRIVLTANFGHGKSHLALTLANLFARPAKSEEVRIIFERLGQALNNPAALSGYREFKQSKGEFLVIRLRGDAFDDLQEGFLNALEQALSEHDCTRGHELPFWHAQAEAWLGGLSGEARQKAESFLAGLNTDLASLRQDVRKSGAYELIRETFKHLTGAYPDFGREVSLKDLVLWAVDKVCVPNKMGGLLILFDEFSLFLQKYAASRAAGKLQDLLNGISDRQGKSAFLAFTQVELESVLETYAHGTRRDDVRKELERLPKDKRFRLFSLMESVLESYLKQDENVWQGWLQSQPIRSAMTRNRETLYDYFSQRYNIVLQWGPEKTQQTILKGCFPLHPLTTAILSSHTFEAGTGENPRTALHFVRDRWEKGIAKQPAEREDGTPNFVFPIELVDFFGEQISKKWYEAYHSALQTSPIPLNEEHRAALKALLLQQAVSALDRKKASGSDQLGLLSALSGLSYSKLKAVLRELSENRVIQFDPDRKVSSLLPVGARSLEADKIILEAIQKIPVDRTLLDEIAKSIPRLHISQNFGSAEDWSPRQVILTEEFFTPQTLKTLLSPYRAGTAAIEEGARGLVIWLLAQTEEEKLRLRQNAQKILDESLEASDHPLPVAIMLPKQPTPSLLEAARRKRALANLSQRDREKIGAITYQNELQRAESDFRTNFYNLIDPEHYGDLPRQLHEYALPATYRASAEIHQNTSLKSVLSILYRRAYAHRIEFSDKPINIKGVNHLKTAVENVTRWLLRDAAGKSIDNLKNKDIQFTVAHYYLTEKWGLLTPGQYSIQPPNSLALREAWNRLEATFPPGCEETRACDTLLELLNPPYGHDYNTLTLLLAAWIGYRRHEIRLSLGGQLVSSEDFKNYFDQTKGPKDFLDRLIVTNPLAISRINTDEMFAEVDSILEQIRQNQTFSLRQAQQALAKLEQAQKNPSLSIERRAAIESYAPRLQEAISAAKSYDMQASKLLNDLNKADFDHLLSFRASLDDLTPPTLVSPSQPAPDHLGEIWQTRLERELEIFCRKYSELKDLSDYKAHQTQLNKALHALKAYPALCSVVQNALDALEQRHHELKQIESEKSIIAEINGMAVSAGLADLYRYQKRLTEFKNLSPQTERLRQQKTDQIEDRIQQFVELIKPLSQAIDAANSLTLIRQQKESILRNLDQVKQTPLYDTLTELKKKIESLEKFFERLAELDRMPQQSPQDLNALEAQIENLGAEFLSSLAPAQIDLFACKKQELAETRQRKAQEAQSWLIDLAQKYKSGAKLDELLRLAENPHPFLPPSDLVQLEKLKKTIQSKMDEDRLLKIETLFTELDPPTRRACLQRLEELMEKL